MARWPMGGPRCAVCEADLERIRRTRHAAQYFDPLSPPIEAADADWAIATAQARSTAPESSSLSLRRDCSWTNDQIVSGSSGRPTTVSWNEPLPEAGHPGPRIVAWTGRPSRSSARARDA